MCKEHTILSKVLETPIYIPDNHSNLITSLEDAFECSLPNIVSNNTVGVLPDGVVRRSNLFDIFYGRDGTTKAIPKGSFQESSAFLPDNIVEMGLLNYKTVLSHFKVAREERLSNGYYETMTPDTSRKVFKRATSEKQMAQFFDIFSEYATGCLHENLYIPVDDFPTRKPRSGGQSIFYIALPGKDNTCFCDIAALNNNGEIVGMVTGGNRYVIPEYRGQNIGVEMVLIDELFPGLKAMSQKGDEHSYTPGGLKSREKAIRHIQNYLDAICATPKPIYTLSP